MNTSTSEWVTFYFNDRRSERGTHVDGRLVGEFRKGLLDRIRVFDGVAAAAGRRFDLAAGLGRFVNFTGCLAVAVHRPGNDITVYRRVRRLVTGHFGGLVRDGVRRQWCGRCGVGGGDGSGFQQPKLLLHPWENVLAVLITVFGAP